MHMHGVWNAFSGMRVTGTRLFLSLMLATAPVCLLQGTARAQGENPVRVQFAEAASEEAPSGEAPENSAETPDAKPGSNGDQSPDGETDPAAPEGADSPAPEAGEAPESPESTGVIEDDYVPPEIITDLDRLPFPARKMRELILAAAKAGDIEKLRPYIGYGSDVTMLSLGGIDDDPITFLKSLSGDGEGHEILAILIEVLEAGFVHLDEGTDHELYVWPYFFAYPIDKLTPPQKVELYKLVTHGDYEDMEAFGAYIFYRVGITPQGRWRFFVAGD